MTAQHALFLVLYPTALVAKAHERPDDALHLVGETVALRGRVRILRARLLPVRMRRIVDVHVRAVVQRLGRRQACRAKQRCWLRRRWHGRALRRRHLAA